MERLAAFAVGLSCGLLQASLVYSLGFLYSATAPAYLAVLLGWLLGGAVGCWIPPRFGPRWLFGLAALIHGANTWLLLHGIYWGSWMWAAGLGGAAGSYWLCHRSRRELARILFYESLGTAAGFLAIHTLIYPWGLSSVLGAPVVTLLLTAREGIPVETHA
ncbi:MAG: hypothetical protein J0I12_15700 [Candidatus Eremiobacteraeota bacterium]|nr:hypothetical protein [Candidatus Eremiobacteraeota bacterium]